MIRKLLIIGFFVLCFTPSVLATGGAYGRVYTVINGQVVGLDASVCVSIPYHPGGPFSPGCVKTQTGPVPVSYTGYPTGCRDEQRCFGGYADGEDRCDIVERCDGYSCSQGAMYGSAEPGYFSFQAGDQTCATVKGIPCGDTASVSVAGTPAGTWHPECRWEQSSYEVTNANNIETFERNFKWICPSPTPTPPATATPKPPTATPTTCPISSNISCKTPSDAKPEWRCKWVTERVQCGITTYTIGDTCCPTITPTSTNTPTPTTTPTPTKTLITPTITPTPPTKITPTPPIQSKCEVVYYKEKYCLNQEDKVIDCNVCWPEARKVVIRGKIISLPTNNPPYTLEKSWYIVEPKNYATKTIYMTEPAYVGKEFTVTADWPGIPNPKPNVVEIHAGANIIENKPNPPGGTGPVSPECTAGIDYFWTPFTICETPTPTPPKNKCVLEVKKTIDKTSAKCGDTLTYTINFKNIGTETCGGGGSRLRDEIDINTNYIVDSVKQGGTDIDQGYSNYPLYESSTRLLRWDTNELIPGESGWVSYQVKVESKTCGSINVTNTAYMMALQLDPHSQDYYPEPDFNTHTWVSSNSVSTAIQNDCLGKAIPTNTPTPAPEEGIKCTALFKTISENYCQNQAGTYSFNGVVNNAPEGSYMKLSWRQASPKSGQIASSISKITSSNMPFTINAQWPGKTNKTEKVKIRAWVDVFNSKNKKIQGCSASQAQYYYSDVKCGPLPTAAPKKVNPKKTGTQKVLGISTRQTFNLEKIILDSLFNSFLELIKP